MEVLRGEMSKREVLSREGIHWGTLKKILSYTEPPGNQRIGDCPKPKIGLYLERIEEVIKSDKYLPKKQRHTVKRIYERIKELGYEGKYTQVKEAGWEITRIKQEVYMPLIHLGEQVSENEARVKSEGRETKPYSYQLPESIPHKRLID